MPVRPSVRMEQLRSHWTDFHGTWYLSIFRKPVEKIQVLLKSIYFSKTCWENSSFIKIWVFSKTCWENSSFIKIYLSIFRKPVEKIQVLLKSIWVFFENLLRKFNFYWNLTRITATFWRAMYIYGTISLISSYKERYFRRSFIENQNEHCMINSIVWSIALYYQ